MKTDCATGAKIAQRAFLATLLISLFAFTPSSLDAAKTAVKVGGFGLFGNAELRSSLRLLEIEEGELNAQKIDDGAFLLLTRLTQNGYLDASISAMIETANSTEESVTWTSPFEPQVADGVVATKLHYTINQGTLYYYDSVSITGLISIDPEEAIRYIIPNTSLYSRKKDRSYSPSIVSNHQKQLAAALSALGRTDAKVTAESIDIDKKTGAVKVGFNVEEGPLYKITSAETHYLKDDAVVETKPIESGANYTRGWVEDQTRTIRNESYRLGFPDTKVNSRIVKAIPEGDTVSVHIVFEVRRGPQIILSGIEHQGATDTHLPLLNRKTQLDIGAPLDITKVESARRRLSQLGIFERIDLKYQEDGTGQRKAVFDYQNGERLKAQLLFGYGSYEQFRAGLLAQRENLFGRAHSLSFSAIRSLKSTSGKLDYTVPEILGESIDATFGVNFLDRQELYFDRVEQGLSLGLFKRLPALKTDIGLDYAFDRKESSDPQFNADLQLDETNIGSLSLRATRSTLDNILYPTSGYDISGAFRFASEALGGQTEFIRPEISAAYHKKLGERWLFHLGAKGGAVRSPNKAKIAPPNGERFLIGGENSLRGYRRGEAGPIDKTTGLPITAEAFALINVELEYPIFDQFNVVLFADSARIWESSKNRSVYDDLTSVGLGFRYNTIVGPVRLEYGHNLDPRPEDPKGTVHLSIGFPF